MVGKNLTPEKRGVLKGVLGTSLVFSVGIAIGAFFLHRKHEEELDKLELDTATTCLDIATDHFESVIRHNYIRKDDVPEQDSLKVPLEDSQESAIQK